MTTRRGILCEQGKESLCMYCDDGNQMMFVFTCVIHVMCAIAKAAADEALV